MQACDAPTPCHNFAYAVEFFISTVFVTKEIMGWIIPLTILGGLAYLLLRQVRKPPADRYSPSPTLASHVTLQTDIRKPAAPIVPKEGPITTQKAACELLDTLLESRSTWFRKSVASDMRQEMREHIEELRSNIEFLKQEMTNQREYREVIADNLDDEEFSSEPDDEATARTRRHLGHLDREMAEMKAKIAACQQALREFRIDRTAWVHAYAQHIIDNGPSPNVSREPLTPKKSPVGSD
jgi:hypothetical protein